MAAIVYPTDKTTGHSHDMEEVYFILSEEERWSSEDDFPFRPGRLLLFQSLIRPIIGSAETAGLPAGREKEWEKIETFLIH
jgi:hypothetical protein